MSGPRLCINMNEFLSQSCVRPQEEPDLKAIESRRIHKQIEADIREEKDKMQRRIKILLLGCGEAGKSTFIKQMRIIHTGAPAPEEEDERRRSLTEEEKEERTKLIWSEEERINMRRQILMNIIQCVQILLEEMTDQLDSTLTNNAAKLSQMKPDSEKDQRKLWEYRDFINAIWEDPAIQATYKKRHQFQLPDCCSYFLTQVERVTQPDFLPKNEDIVQIRVTTTGVIEYSFTMNKINKEFIMIDVGGQRSERKKWIHCFEDVLLLMFLCAASEYDQVLFEDQKVNRMTESLNLFINILSFHWFDKSAVALFLNKKDLLADKVKHSDLEDYFPDFKGYKHYKKKDYGAAMGFIKEMFIKARRPDSSLVVDKERSFFVHETCATDTTNVKRVFKDVQATIVDNVMQDVMY